MSPRRTRLVASPLPCGTWHILRQVGADAYEWVVGVSETLYPSAQAAREATL